MIEKNRREFVKNISGIDTMEILEENLAMTQRFKSLTQEEKSEMTSRSIGKSDIIEHYLRKK